MDSFIAFISDTWPLIITVFASVFLAAFFAASETAIVFSNKAHIQELSEAGNARAAAVLTLLHERDRLHAVILLAENFFIVLSAVLGTVVFADLFNQISLAAM